MSVILGRILSYFWQQLKKNHLFADLSLSPVCLYYMLDLVEKREEKHTVDRRAGITALKIIKGRKTAVK